MLVPFALDADGLVPDPAWTTAQQRSVHLALLDIWKRIGLLVHNGERFDQSRIKGAIDALPQKLAPLWQELLERLPLAPGPDGWDGAIANSPGCLDLVEAAGRVALVDDAKAEIDFGMPEGELSISLPGHPRLEVCRLLAAQHARPFTDAAALCGQHIPAGQTYQQLWSARFATLARAPIKTVAIVDRYVISQHYECPQHQLSGLERFLRLLDGDASGRRYVTVFSAWTVELNRREPHVTLEMVAEEMRATLGRLARQQVRRVRLVMLPNLAFGNVHHDRFVRFGEHIWDLGIGVKVFEGPAVSQRSEASFKTCLLAPAYRDVEVELDQHAQARRIEVQV